VALAVINAIGNIGSPSAPFDRLAADITGSFSSGLWFVAGLLVVGALIIWAIPMKGTRRARDAVRSRHVPEPDRQYRYQ
jgi:ACS family 4-hydroxyphenylacetate permease-like MFS transporter